MAGSSSRFDVPIFSGEGFGEWSRKMKRQLIVHDLWYIVELGPMSMRPTVMQGDWDCARILQEDKKYDLKALALILKSLSPAISIRLHYVKTAKEAWDILHENFKMNDPSPAEKVEEGGKTLKPTTAEEMAELERNRLNDLRLS